MPKLIVVTGYYNRTAKLRESVYSVLNQDFDDFMYYVFDDCSTDQTGQELAKIEHPKYEFISHSGNKGFVKGLIDVIDDTDSEYIAIHGSGDFSLEGRLKNQVEFLDNNRAFALTGSAYENCYESNISIKRPDRDVYTNEDLKIANPFTHGEVMFRREVYERAGGYSEYFKFSQDYDLWLRMSKIAPLAVLPDVYYKRFIQMDGVSYSPDKLIRQKKFALLARALNEGNINREDFPELGSFDVADYISDRNSEILKKKILMTAVLVKHRQFSNAFDLLKKM